LSVGKGFFCPCVGVFGTLVAQVYIVAAGLLLAHCVRIWGYEGICLGRLSGASSATNLAFAVWGEEAKFVGW